MPIEASIPVICRKCGHKGNKQVPRSINASEEPSLKEAVRSGSLFTWECPECGTVNMVQSDLLYHDPDNRLMLWLLPDAITLEAETMILSLWSSIQADESMGDYIFRRVNDAGSLIEKVRIAEAGMEDAAVEMCKYVTAMELAQQEKNPQLSAALSSASLRFNSMEGPDNLLRFVFSLDGAMHSVEVGFNVYEDCRAILGRNPDIIPSGPFPIVDSGWVAKTFR